jgi:hypothetical protein
MSFDVAETPRLEAVSTEDEELLAQDLQARVEETANQAETNPEVVEANASRTASRSRLDGLRAAERNLNRHAKESRDQISSVSTAALDTLVESAAAGRKPEFKKLTEVMALESQNRGLGRALERLAEHLIPLAEIAALRDEAHADLTRARTLERFAQERAEKVLGRLREAVSDELVLPVDMSKGVAGALLARAANLKRSAIQVSENADRIERSYQSRKEIR